MLLLELLELLLLLLPLDYTSICRVVNVRLIRFELGLELELGITKENLK